MRKKRVSMIFKFLVSTFACLALMFCTGAGKHSTAIHDSEIIGRTQPDYYHEERFVCTGEVTKYPVYRIQATESLLATIKEEIKDLKRDFPGCKMTSFSSQSIACLCDLIYISKPSHKKMAIAYDVTAFIDADHNRHHRMTKEEALEIVKYMIQQDILAIDLPEEYLKHIDSWPVISSGTLDVYTPDTGLGVSCHWTFGDWTHRLYGFGCSTETSENHRNVKIRPSVH